MSKRELETSLVIPATTAFVERRIYLIRGQKVLLDFDLAELYQTPTKVFNQAIKRNLSRFPSDFMFQLSSDEAGSLRSQIVTSKVRRGGNRYQPYAFTELGVAMLSSVLNSDRAVQMNIFIMRAFVKLRELIATHKDLSDKIASLEGEQKKQGRDIDDLIVVVNKLVSVQTRPKNAIGFETDPD